jgi:hypothetical protein
MTGARDTVHGAQKHLSPGLGGVAWAKKSSASTIGLRWDIHEKDRSRKDQGPEPEMETPHSFIAMAEKWIFHEKGKTLWC